MKDKNIEGGFLCNWRHFGSNLKCQNFKIVSADKDKEFNVRSCLVIGATSDQFSLGVSVCFRSGTSWKGKRKMQDERRLEPALKGFRQN